MIKRRKNLQDSEKLPIFADVNIIYPLKLYNYEKEIKQKK